MIQTQSQNKEIRQIEIEVWHKVWDDVTIKVCFQKFLYMQRNKPRDFMHKGSVKWKVFL